MARKIRIENPGFHHIVNRGVNRRTIFDTSIEKEKFLEILCEISAHYDFVIHAYVLMGNHYHLLLENRRENLSAGMRQINASYAMYYNKKHRRTGHLWQGRYKSWYIFDESYLINLLRYIELNPVAAGLGKKAGDYGYTLVYDLLHGTLRPCMRESFVFKWYDSTKELLEAVRMKMSEEELEKIARFQKEATAYKTKPAKFTQAAKLEHLFHPDMTRQERNEAILTAWKTGHTQSEIARHLHLSDAAVHKILKKLKVKPSYHKE